MARRIIATAALVACTGLYALAATERATFILTDGERKSGPVVFHTATRENLIDGDFSLGRDDGGKELIFHSDQVAVIDFVGGQPATSELAQLPASGHLLVMRDGTSQTGRFVNMIGGETVVWTNQAGQRQQYAIRDVSRIYLNPQSARIAFNYTVPAGVTGTAGTVAQGTPARGTAAQGTAAQGTTVRVDATQAWSDTGLTVNQGDRVVFRASGQIQFGRSAGQTATPGGNPAERRAVYPDPTVPVGTLLGRVGNSAPFAIGMQSQPLVMPASGRLMLGINDNELGDNSGFYSVVVTKQ
jgi:PA-IL-like protein